jgi:glycosyltransferase involved in cell wall biosynthesis
METLDLAFVADRCSPFYMGGYESHLYQLARSLAGQHRVTVFTSTPRSQIARADFRMVRIAPRLSYTRKRGGHDLLQSSAFGLFAFVGLPRLNRFDLVDILGIPYVHLPGLRLRRQFFGFPMAVTVWEAWTKYSFHRGRLSGVSSRAFRLLVQLAVAGDHLIITGSTRTRSALHASWGVPMDRLAVVSPAVDFNKVGPIQRVPRPIDVLFVGRLDWFKRVSDILKACARISRLYTHFSVVIAGDGPELPTLRKVAYDLGLVGRAALVGRVEEAEKFRLMKASKVFVMPSEREGFSIATLEAMACGAVPIVAVPDDPGAYGIGDLVDGLGDQVTYPVGSTSELEEKIAAILADDGARHVLAERAVQSARRFDYTNLGRTYVSAVRSFVSGRSRLV